MNEDLKNYYDQHYNKDGKGPPFEQLSEVVLGYVAESMEWHNYMRELYRKINTLLIKEMQNAKSFNA